MTYIGMDMILPIAKLIHMAYGDSADSISPAPTETTPRNTAANFTNVPSQICHLAEVYASRYRRINARTILLFDASFSSESTSESCNPFGSTASQTLEVAVFGTVPSRAVLHCQHASKSSSIFSLHSAHFHVIFHFRLCTLWLHVSH